MNIGKSPARVTVMGLGLFGGGEGAVRFWAEIGAKITVTDLKTAEELAPGLERIKGLPCRLVLGRHDSEDFVSADILVVNPAVKPGNHYVELARQNGAKIITEVGTVMQLLQGHIFGVTGSNGKSTTTALLGNILRKIYPDVLVGGNIGGSLLDSVKTCKPSVPVVLELSSFQLHYLASQNKSPNTAIVTNLSPNHTDWHGGKAEYYAAKRNIFAYQWPEDVAVLNNDDPVLREWAGEMRQRIALFGMKDPDTPNCAFLRDDKIILRIAGREFEAFSLSGLMLPGRHNIYNAMAATLAAEMYLNDSSLLKEGIRTFKGLPHRIEYVAEIDGIRFYNDSVSTTPESAIAALNSFDSSIVLIAGGYDKGACFSKMADEILKKAEALVLLGATAENIKAEVLAKDSAFNVVVSDRLESAVLKAKELCSEGGCVVLSPACASYGMFANYEERGDLFVRIVKSLT